MRNLRSGHSLGRPNPAPTGSGGDNGGDNGVEEARRGGPVEDEQTFLADLEQTIAEAAVAGERVFVFRLRGAVKGLQRWSGAESLPENAVEQAVEQTILEIGEDLALRWSGGDLLGFDIRPRSGPSAERLGGRLMAGLAKPLGTAGRQFIFSPRLGVCAFDPGKGRSAQALDAAARTLAQTNFTTPFLVHNRYIEERSSREERTGAELPAAMADGSITMEFQPRVSVADGTVKGVEALPRWHHPDRGSVPPLEFLAVAERAGLLVDLGRQLRDMAVDVAREWQRQDIMGDRRLWLNVNPVELTDPGFIPSITELMVGRPYLSIGLEMSDTRLFEDLIFLRIFDRLQEAGVQLALDNVRQTNLSFGRLRRLPLSMINLDGELVRSLPTVSANREIVRLIKDLADERGAVVTACGIENEDHRGVAKACGVELLQGFAVAGVLNSEDAATYLSDPPSPDDQA